MKILQIGKFSENLSGGVETAVFGLSRFLRKNKNLEITVVSSSLDRNFSQFHSENLRYHNLASLCVLFSTPITPSLIGYLKKAQGFDIIIISIPNPMAVIAYLLARPKGKLIVWYHSDIAKPVLNMFFSPFLKIILKKASFIVASSEKYLNSSSSLRAFKDKTAVIPYGIDISLFDNEKDKLESLEIKKSFNSPLVLFIGRLVYYKGLGCLIEAMKGIDAKLLIIGKGVLERKLKALVKNCGLEDKVLFKDVPKNESIAKYIYACDMLALPSNFRSEAFGLVILEAMACRKPVVTTEIGTGTSFACIDTQTGLIIPANDPFALRQAANKILNDKALAKEMGEKGRQRVEERFNVERMGESFFKLFNELKSDE